MMQVHVAKSLIAFFFLIIFFKLAGGQQFTIFLPLRDKKTACVLWVLTGSFNPHDQDPTWVWGESLKRI